MPNFNIPLDNVVVLDAVGGAARKYFLSALTEQTGLGLFGISSHLDADTALPNILDHVSILDESNYDKLDLDTGFDILLDLAENTGLPLMMFDNHQPYHYAHFVREQIYYFSKANIEQLRESLAFIIKNVLKVGTVQAFMQYKAGLLPNCQAVEFQLGGLFSILEKEDGETVCQTNLIIDANSIYDFFLKFTVSPSPTDLTSNVTYAHLHFNFNEFAQFCN